MKLDSNGCCISLFFCSFPSSLSISKFEGTYSYGLWAQNKSEENRPKQDTESNKIYCININLHLICWAEKANKLALQICFFYNLGSNNSEVTQVNKEIHEERPRPSNLLLELMNCNPYQIFEKKICSCSIYLTTKCPVLSSPFLTSPHQQVLTCILHIFANSVFVEVNSLFLREKMHFTDLLFVKGC